MQTPSLSLKKEKMTSDSARRLTTAITSWDARSPLGQRSLWRHVANPPREGMQLTAASYPEMSTGPLASEVCHL